MLTSSFESSIVNHSSRSLGKKRKIYQSNYVKKQEKKPLFFHEKLKTENRCTFRDLEYISQIKPLQISECLSIRNLSPFTKKEIIQRENVEPVRSDGEKEEA